MGSRAPDESHFHRQLIICNDNGFPLIMNVSPLL